jgi:hypothetical protein
MSKMKTRIAYGYLLETGNLILAQDTVKEALRANMMVRDYEKRLVELNPQLRFEFKVEKIK